MFFCFDLVIDELCSLFLPTDFGEVPTDGTCCGEETRRQRCMQREGTDQSRLPGLWMNQIDAAAFPQNWDVSGRSQVWK